MADEDIERLLREIDATTRGPAVQPEAKAPSRTTSRSRGRLVFAGVAAVGLGLAAFVFAILTPLTDAVSMGWAGAFAAFVTALIAGPPRWFSS